MAQCVDLSGTGGELGLFASVRIDVTPADGVTVWGEAELFAAPDCVDPTGEVFATDVVAGDTARHWVPLSLEPIRAGAAVSALVRFTLDAAAGQPGPAVRRVPGPLDA